MADRDKRIAFLPVEASDFIVTIAGRERRWLSRVLGFFLAPLFRWRSRRERRHR